MKVIELDKSKVAIVDDEDFAELAQYRWYVDSYGYAQRESKMVNWVRGKKIKMHRAIMNAQDGQLVDHVNENRLDNRRCNLRFATHAQNLWNRGASKTSKTGEKNICFIKRRNSFFAQIKKNHKRVFAKYFKSIEDAKIARDIQLARHHGEFANNGSRS